MKRKSMVREGIRALRREDTVASTGAHCPATGTWESAQEPVRQINVQRGDLMPPLNGMAVQWNFTPATQRVLHTTSRKEPT